MSYVGHTPFSDTPRCFLLPMWSNWNNHTSWDGLPQGSPTWLVFQLTLRYPEQSFPGRLWLMPIFLESVMNLTLCQNARVKSAICLWISSCFDGYPLVKKITIFNGKSHYKWQVSIAGLFVCLPEGILRRIWCSITAKSPRLHEFPINMPSSVSSQLAMLKLLVYPLAFPIRL